MTRRPIAALAAVLWVLGAGVVLGVVVVVLLALAPFVALQWTDIP